MQITLAIKCPTCLSDSIKKNGIKVDGKQNYQCKDCKRQFIGDHALSYLGCNSGITRKILQLMVRGSGIRDIAEVERISIGKVLRTLTESTYQIQPKQSHYESLEVDEFWTLFYAVLQVNISELQLKPCALILPLHQVMLPRYRAVYFVQ